MNYSTEEEHNHTLADIIINNCASNDSFGSGILTQPPDNDTTHITYTNNMEADMHHQAKQAASNKRKSKLKKSKSSSSKSVLETMSAENSADLSTSGAPTTTTAGTAETKDVSPYPIDLTNSPSPQKVQAAHPTITPASERIVEQRKSATLPDPSSSSVAASSLKENNEAKVAPKKKKAKKSKTSTEDIASTKSQSTTSKSAAKSTGNNTKQQLLVKQ